MKNLIKSTSLCLALFVSALTPSAFASTGTWDGDTSANWNDNANWSAAYPKTSGEIATFNASTLNNTISLNGANITVGRIIFDTANAAGYTFNAGGGTLAVASTSNLGAILINSTVGAVTETFNPQLILAGTRYFINNSTDASLNLAGGVANSATGTVYLGGAGGGGVLNGINQTGGTTSITFANTAGVWEITGSVNATGAISVAGNGGTARISTDLSTTSGISQSTGSTVQINYAGGGLNTSGGYSQTGTLEAYGADRVINTGTHTLGASLFVGNYSLTISSIATMNGSAGSITNDIAAGKSLTFNNAGNFSLSESSTSRIRIIGGGGNTIITSNVVNGGGSTASGITKTGSGTLQLSGNNTYGGQTQVSGGVLRLDSANALPGGIGTTGGTSNLLINLGGVIGLGNGDFTRNLGTGVTDVQFSGGGGGFAAYGTDRNVNIGGASATLAWNQTSFIADGAPLVLGASDATNKVTFQNGLNLHNLTQTVQVNKGSGAIDGEISGVISSTVAASGALTKTGLGTLVLSNTNTYGGATTISSGTLLVNGAHTAAGSYSVAGGTLGGSGTIATASNAGIKLEAGSKLSPGSASGLTGTLSADLGTGAFDISAGVDANNSQSLLFDLTTTAASDRVLLSNAGSTFNIGTGKLEFNDFVFSTGAGFGAGTYTLFDSSHTITGSLGSSLTGILSGLTATISFANSNQDIILTVTAVPEPGIYGALAGLALTGLSLTSVIRRRIFSPRRTS